MCSYTHVFKLPATKWFLWNKFSLDQAMQGLEKDELPEYYESDLKEKYAK